MKPTLILLLTLTGCDAAPTVPPVVCSTVVNMALAEAATVWPRFVPIWDQPATPETDAAFCVGLGGTPGPMLTACASAVPPVPGMRTALTHHLLVRHGLPVPAVPDGDNCALVLGGAMTRSLGEAIDRG
jgi:hypothetical protein